MAGYVACLLVLLATARIEAAPVRSHVLEDRLIDGYRSVSVVVEREGACVPPEQLEVAAPFARTAKTACVAELLGPRDATPQIRVGGELVATTLGAASTPVAPTAHRVGGHGRTIELEPVPLVPIEHVAVGAYLFVSNDGQPTNDVELNVVAEGASPRALDWIEPGVARIELVVPTWRPSITLIVQHGSDAPVRAEIAVDAGPPTVVTVNHPPIIANAEFSLDATVTTTGGASVPAEHVRVDAVGCARHASGFVCASAGALEIVVAVEVAGEWIPIDVETSHVAPEVVRVVVVVPKQVEEAVPLRWELGLRGGVDADGSMHGGALAFAARSLSPAITGLLGIGWEYQHARFAGLAPVTSDLDVSEQQFAVLAGGRYELAHGLSVRAAIGPALVRQHDVVGGMSAMSNGLRGLAILTGGARTGTERLSIGVDAGVQAAVDLAATTWPRSATELVLEVTLGGRL